MFTRRNKTKIHLQSNFDGSNIFGTMGICLDMSSSSHQMLVIAPGHEANRVNLEIYFRYSRE